MLTAQLADTVVGRLDPPPPAPLSTAVKVTDELGGRFRAPELTVPPVEGKGANEPMLFAPCFPFKYAPLSLTLFPPEHDTVSVTAPPDATDVGFALMLIDPCLGACIGCGVVTVGSEFPVGFTTFGSCSTRWGIDGLAHACKRTASCG